MSTITDDRDPGAPPPRPLPDLKIAALPRCIRCDLSYMPTKSTSALRLTYCSFLCELGHLGFSMAGLEHMERVKKPIELPVETPPEPTPAVID